MPRPRRTGKARTGYNRPLELEETFALRVGGNGFSDTCPFPGEEARREAWRFHGERITTDYEQAGKRPAAWWQFDSPEPRDERVYEAVQLVGMGLVTGPELKDLTERWAFDEGQGFNLADSMNNLDLEAYHGHCDQYQIPSDYRRFPL